MNLCPKQLHNTLYGQILNLALPLILANLVQQIYNLIDIFFLGRYKSSIALAAAGASIQISWVLIYIFIGLSVGAGIVTAQAFGSGDTKKLGLSVHTTASLSLISGIILTCAGIFSAPLLLNLINIPPEVFPEAKAYLQIHFLSMLPFLIYSMASAILRGIGDTKTSMYALLASLVVKAILVYFFIKSRGLGVTWAAMATVFAQTTAAAFVVVRLLKTPGAHRLKPSELLIDKPTFIAIVGIGVPTGLQLLVQYLANVYFQSQVNIFGSDVMAGMLTFTRIEGFIYMPIEGFALAASTLTGQSIGAKQPGLVKTIMLQTSIMSVGLTLILSFGVFVFGQDIVTIFNPHNPKAVEVGLLFILYIVPLYFFYSITQNFGGVIRGTGEARIPMAIVLFFTCGVRLVWISLVRENLSLLCLTYPISWSATFLAFIVYYRRGNWLKKHLK